MQNKIIKMYRVEEAAVAAASQLSLRELAVYAKACPSSHFVAISADDWWGGLSDDRKKKYLDEHPNSMFKEGSHRHQVHQLIKQHMGPSHGVASKGGYYSVHKFAGSPSEAKRKYISIAEGLTKLGYSPSGTSPDRKTQFYTPKKIKGPAAGGIGIRTMNNGLRVHHWGKRAQKGY